MISRTPITSEGLLELGFKADVDEDKFHYTLNVSKFDCVTELKPFHREGFDVDEDGEIFETIELDVDSYEFNTYSHLDEGDDINSVYFYVSDFNSPTFRLMYIEQILEMYKFITGEDLV